MAGSPWGGSEYLWAATAEHALAEGHDVIISLHQWSVNHPLVQRLQQCGAKLLPRPLPAHGLAAGLAKRALKKVTQRTGLVASSALLSQKAHYQQVFDQHPDVICLSQGSCYDIFSRPELLQLLSDRAIPYIVLCQLNIDTYIPGDEIRTVTYEQFKRAASVAFVSQHNLKLMERQLACAIPNGIVVQNPVNLQERSIVPWPQQPVPRFASVARLEAIDKGQDLLFEALSSPDWRQRDWECHLYGSGADRPYLEALANHYGIGDRVTFAGHVSSVRSIWADNHLLVLPSRSEGTPLSLIEAMLCGRPAVVTDVGGNTEWVEEAKTGFIAEATTAHSIHAALERAWLAQHKWETMGRHAHDYAIATCDPYPGKRLLQLMLTAAKT